MSDPTTTNIVLAVPTRGSDVGTWDSPINGDMNILDGCAGSVTSKSLTNANVTLSTPESQVSILRFSGTLSGNVTITLGAIIKSWVVENVCTGAFVVTVQGSPATGNVVGLPPGSCQIYWDGTNISFVNLGRIGEYWDYPSTAVPSWVTACSIPPYLHCNGGSFSAVTYPLLSGILGTTTLPDTLGRGRFNLDGGTGRITTSGSGVNGAVRFSTGGAQDQTITQSVLPNYALPTTLAISDSRTWGINSPFTPIVGSPGSSFGGGPVGANGTNQVIVTGGGIGLTGSTTLGGSGFPLTTMPPCYIGGITMIRAG